MRHTGRFINTALLALFVISASSGSRALKSSSKEWYFNVYLDDTPIGYHHFIVNENPHEQQVFIKAEFDVKLLFFSIYTYLHDNSETWQGQCLIGLSSSTNDNGDEQFVSLQKNDDNYIIESRNQSNVINTCVRSFAYWNLDLLNSKQLLNAQTGELVDIEFKYLGKDTLALNSKSISSEHYRLVGKDLEIDLWYSTDKLWLGLQSRTEHGNILRYQLRQENIQ